MKGQPSRRIGASSDLSEARGDSMRVSHRLRANADPIRGAA